jgi:hypothetical protein
MELNRIERGETSEKPRKGKEKIINKRRGEK